MRNDNPESLLKADLLMVEGECGRLLEALKTDRAFDLRQIKRRVDNLQQSIATLEGEKEEVA